MTCWDNRAEIGANIRETCENRHFSMDSNRTRMWLKPNTIIYFLKDLSFKNIFLREKKIEASRIFCLEPANEIICFAEIRQCWSDLNLHDDLSNGHTFEFLGQLNHPEHVFNIDILLWHHRRAVETTKLHVMHENWCI